MNMDTGHVEQITTAIAEYDSIAAGLAAMRDKYQGAIYDVATRDGMESAKAARAEIRAPRYRVEQIRKDAKRPILELGKMLDKEAKRITDEIRQIEDPIDAQIKAEEQRIEDEKRAKIAAEVARVEAIKERIKELEGNQLLTPSSGSELIGQHIDDLDKIAVDGSFAEFRETAERTKTEALDRLRTLHAAAIAHEVEQARIEAERAELERLRAEREEQNRIERQRLEAEREKQEAAARVDREKLEAERAEIERLAAELEQKKAEPVEVQGLPEIDVTKPVPPQNPDEPQTIVWMERSNSRPTDDEIAKAVADRWCVLREVAHQWLMEYGQESKV